MKIDYKQTDLMQASETNDFCLKEKMASKQDPQMFVKVSPMFGVHVVF